MELHQEMGWSMPDGHATGLLGLQPVLDRLSDPSHRCQGPELTCLLQALCKQLISAATDTNLAIFTSADRARLASAQAAGAEAAADLSIGAPEQSVASPQPFSSVVTSSCHARTHSEIEPPASAKGTSNSTNTTPLLGAPPNHTTAQRATPRAEAEPARRPLAGPGRGSLPAGQASNPSTQAPASASAHAKGLAGMSPAASEPTQGLAGMVASGIALLVDHLEHFHYRAKAVALDGLLSLSAVGLGPDRRLDPAGVASLPLPAHGSGGASACSSAAAAAAVAAAAALAAGAGLDGQRPGEQPGQQPEDVADAVQALGGLGLGDWLALRIVGAGAVPRLLEMLTQRTGINFVPVRQLASQVMHNLARRRNPAVRAALARWRPLPGIISGLDVVLEDSPEIAARLLLVLSDVFPITSHQIAGVLHKLIAKQQEQAGGQPQPQQQASQQQQQPQQAPQLPPAPQPQQQAAGPGGAGRGGVAGGDAKVARGAQPADPSQRPAAAAEPAAAATRARRAKAAVAPAPEPAAGRGAAAAGRPRRGAAAAAAVAPQPAAPVAPAPLPPAAEEPAAATTYPGLAPDVDVPLEALLMRVTGYYMRLAYTAVIAPAPLPPTSSLKAPYSDAERRDYEKAILTQKLEEHRRRRKEAGQLDCCVAALLAAAPMPTCLFDALSYSHTRAFAVLAGPPLNLSLASTTNGGLWRAQDLLPYALTMIQSLGGGSDTGDGGSAGSTGRAVAPNAAANLLMSAGALGGAGAGRPLNGNTIAVSTALDRFWSLVPQQGAASTAGPLDCAGPALPGAPYGDKPVTAGLMHQCGVVIRAVLERAVQAADALPAAASSAAAAAAAAAAASAAGGSASSSVLAAHQTAYAELPTLAVLRSVGATLLTIVREQTADRILDFGEALGRLTPSLAQHTGSAAAGVAQARMALGLANLWACLHTAAEARARKYAAHQAGSDPKTGGGEGSCGEVASGSDTAGAPAERSGSLAAAGHLPVVTAEDEKVSAGDADAAASNLRRSARIKRRRDGAAAATAAAATQQAAAKTGADAAAGASRGNKAVPASGAQAADQGHAGVQGAAGGAAAAASTALAADEAAAATRREAFLGDLVDLLASRFAEVRQLQDGLDLQLRQQQSAPGDGSVGGAPEDGSGSSLGLASAASLPLGLLPSTAGGAAGPWLAAAAAAVVGTTPADRARLVLEAQAALLQAVALLGPGLSAAHARRLVDAGAVHCCARIVRAAAAPSPSATAATTGAAAAGDSGADPGTSDPAARPRGVGASSQGAADTSGQPENNRQREQEQQWNEEPLYGVTAVQALGLMVELLQLSGGGSYGSGGVQHPETLAALGGALLLTSSGQRGAPLASGGNGDGAAGLLLSEAAARLQVSGARGQQVAPGLKQPNGTAVAAAEDANSRADPVGRFWDVLLLMSSGQRPCAFHDATLQLLVPLAALTHGSSRRCAAARAALAPVLLQVTKWAHSKTQRRRLFAQVFSLWRPHLQPLLLRLPRMASPSAPGLLEMHPPGVVAVAVATDPPLPAGAKGPGPVGRTSSQSTMPYVPSTRGSGRFSTPTTNHQQAHYGPVGNSGSVSGVGVAAAAVAAQRTPPWGGSAASSYAPGGAVHGTGCPPGRSAAAAAAAAVMLSPTRHTATSASGFNTAVPPAPNHARGRRGSRLGVGLPTSPLLAPRGVVNVQQGGEAVADVGAPAVVAGAGALAEAPGGSDAVSVGVLCELLEAVMERLADSEVLRHLHAAGWLRALSHGASCADVTVRESCRRALAHAARALAVPGGRPPSGLMLTDLEADAELRGFLLDGPCDALAPGPLAAGMQQQQQLRITSMLPPRVPTSAAAADGLALRAGSVTAAAAPRGGPHGTGPLLPPSGGAAAGVAPSAGSHPAVDTAAEKDQVQVIRTIATEAEEEAGREAFKQGLPPGALKLDLSQPPLESAAPARRSTRGRKAASGAAATGRGRKGARVTSKVAAASAGAGAAVQEDKDDGAAAGGGAQEGTGVSVGGHRTRARKAAVTRRNRSAAAAAAAAQAQQGGHPEGAQEDASLAGSSGEEATGTARRLQLGGLPVADDAVEVADLTVGVDARHGQAVLSEAAADVGPSAAGAVGGGQLLVSPLPKRRRVTEDDPLQPWNEADGADEDEEDGALAVGAAVEGQGARVLLGSGAGAGASKRTAATKPAVGLTAGLEVEVLVASGGEEDEVRGSQAAVWGPDAAAIVTATAPAALQPAAAGLAATGLWPPQRIRAHGGPVPSGSPDRNLPLDLQLSAREAKMAAAVRAACVSLESALAARRHDLTASRAAEQAAAAAAAAAATIAISASVTGAMPPPLPPPPATQTQPAVTDDGPAARKKGSRVTRTGAAASAGTAPAAAKGAATRAAPVPAQPPQPAAATAQAPAVVPPAPVAVADEEFLSRTYRGVSKRLNFDDM